MSKQMLRKLASRIIKNQGWVGKSIDGRFTDFLLSHVFLWGSNTNCSKVSLNCIKIIRG